MTTCATCDVYVCWPGRADAAPEDCPMRTNPDLVDTREIYSEPAIREPARVSALVMAEGRRTRIEDTMEFARGLGIKKLGLAFCVGLRQEAKVLNRVLEANGFEVASVCCKTGGISKAELGIAEEVWQKAGQHPAMCNSIAQARLLNEAGTGLNVLFGLCPGHDALFSKHSDALVTTLVVKDRVLAHNPVGALNCAYGYYNKALYQGRK